MYIAPAIVKTAFKRLVFTHKTKGKMPLERTSSIMYFLAFDATAKKGQAETIDIDIKTPLGKNVRETFVLEYAKLVSLSNSSKGGKQQIAALGEIQQGGKEPEKKIASNFLSVPVVKAATSSTPYAYPKRPAPLLFLGLEATGLPYGMTYHTNWIKNLRAFLSDFKSNTPFTDLAITCLRAAKGMSKDKTFHDGLASMIRAKFTENLSEVWIKAIDGERSFIKHIPLSDYCTSEFHDVLGCDFKVSRKDELLGMSKSDLVDIILTLESNV